MLQIMHHKSSYFWNRLHHLLTMFEKYPFAIQCKAYQVLYFGKKSTLYDLVALFSTCSPDLRSVLQFLFLVNINIYSGNP
jgi:hypothetical protein